MPLRQMLPVVSAQAAISRQRKAISHHCSNEPLDRAHAAATDLNANSRVSRTGLPTIAPWEAELIAPDLPS